MYNLNRTRLARQLPMLALLSANAVSMTGNAMANVAIPWFVLETTGSAAKTGLTFALRKGLIRRCRPSVNSQTSPGPRWPGC